MFNHILSNMKIKSKSFFLKEKVLISSFIILLGFVINSYSASIYSKIIVISSDLTAVISSSTESLCIGEQADITFEGAGGTAPYSFIYELNGEEQAPITTSTDSSISFQTEITNAGTYVYELIKVKDDLESDYQDISDQVITIIVSEFPVADFSFSNDSSCSGETIAFIPDVTGSGTYSYNWNFGDDSESNQEFPTHIFVAEGFGSQIFSIELTVTDNVTSCSTVITKEITVLEIPIINFGDATFNSFSNCGSEDDSEIFDIRVENYTTSSNNIISYEINWGDGNITSSATFPADHQYTTVGIYSMNISALNDNGCSNNWSDTVVNISNPSGGISSPGFTADLCAPTDLLEFGIPNWGGNSSDTYYEVNWGDGSSIETYTQTQLLASSFYNATDPENSSDFPITHIYTTGSCELDSGSFTVGVIAFNECGNTPATVSGITVLEASEAIFTIQDAPVPLPDPYINCIDTPITFINESNIGDGNGCSAFSKFTWDFGDGTDPIIITTSNADYEGSQTHTYTAPGTYIVTLEATGKCGSSTTTETICIEPELIPSFTVDSQEGCIPFNVNTTNSTNETGICSDPNYNWSVTYESSNCGSAGDWDFINGTNENSENPKLIFNTPGKYTLTQNIITDCNDVSSQVIIDVKKPPTTSINPIDDFCQPGVINPIAIVENCTDDSSGISYNWTFTGGTPANSTLSSPENISYETPGTYTITLVVTNECGISNTASQDFQVLQKPIMTNTELNQEICSTQSSSAISLSANNSASSFRWSLYSLGPNITGVSPTSGTSQVIPSQTLENNGSTPEEVVFEVIPILNVCEGDPIYFTITVNPGPSITTAPVGSAVCLDGSATLLEVVTQDGVGTPTYQWYENNTNTTTGGTAISGATSASYDPPTSSVGAVYYYVIISFEGGCSALTSATALVIINQIPIISFAQLTIYSEETFLLDPSTIIGNIIPPGTTYTWTTPISSIPGAIFGSSSSNSPQTVISQTLENINDVPVIERYTITPASANCIGIPFILEVTVNPKINSNVEITNNSCYGSNDGTLTTNITGGVTFDSGALYLISWEGPPPFTSTDPIITNLLPGTYTLIIEDKNGVSITEQYIITQPELLIITKDLEKNISCFDGNDGAIEVTVTGGTLSYTLNWTTTSPNPNGLVQNTENQSNLKAGNYTLEVIDGNNCIATKTFILTEPDAINIDIVSKQDILCFGDASGSIEISITGGSPLEVAPGAFEYTYNWTGPGFTNTSQNISNLLPGIYTIEITDTLGCVESKDIVINQPTPIDIDYSKIDVTCYGASDGSIDVNVSGGAPPYQIAWSNFGTGFSQSNLSAGDFIVTITDDNNCVSSTTITINQSIFYIDPTFTTISCNDANDGSIDLNLVGGVAPITITWSDDPSAGVQRNNLGSGTYTVSIVDSDINQCPIEQTFIMTNPLAIAVSTIVSDAVDCTIANSGSILLDVSGGTPPYSFTWNTGQTTEDLNNIPAGDYSVQITDFYGCTEVREFNIFRQDPINISFTETVLADCDLNTIMVQNDPIVTGGFLPYTYSWSAGNISGIDNQTMTTNTSGAYTLTVTDGKGCTESSSIIVDVPPTGISDFSFTAFAISQYGYISIDDPIQFTNLSTGNYSSISWNFGDGSPILSDENPTHIYDRVGVFTVTLAVVYDSGCIFTTSRELNVTKGYSLILPNAFSPNGDGINDYIRPLHKGFKDIEMSIYDTWGALIYYEKELTLEGWDGFLRGKPSENGNYIMYVKGLTFYNREIKESSPITLLK
mgnify:CR=1 FL=1